MIKKLLIIFLIFSFSKDIFSQEINLKIKAGEFIVNKDFNLDISADDNYRLIFFEQIPTNYDKEKMKEMGVTLLEYLPKNIFVASIDKSLFVGDLEEYHVNSVNKVLDQYKIDYKLKNSQFPEWSLKDGRLFIKVIFYEDLVMSDVLEDLNNISTIEYFNQTSNCVTISIMPDDLELISKLNYIFFIEPIDPPSIPENDEARTLHRSNVINSNFSTGRHYDGSGINVMMQDDGIIGPHIDYMGRVDQSNCGGCSTSNSNDHGDHVAGTIMGSGNLDPKGQGMANGAFLYVYSSSNNNYYDVPNLYQNNEFLQKR